MERSKKKSKLKEKSIDRISDLPDPIIHHILSFLPSTTEAVRTGILSKRWRNQWTRVPVLIFDYYLTAAVPPQNFLRFVDTTLILHDCYKIKKFHLRCNYFRETEAKFHERIRFATRKDVEELYLCSSFQERIELPKFLFDNASLIKLRIELCKFMPNIGKVNWKNLKSLSISYCWCNLGNEPEHILSGSPVLESLELIHCSGFTECVIASKSLKRLVLGIRDCRVFEISCPKLEELSLLCMPTTLYPEMSVQVIKKVLSSCLLLVSLKLVNCVNLEQLVIASNSLKSLGLGDIVARFDIEISCPKLENLKLSGHLNVRTIKLLNLPSSLCGAIDFDCGRKSLIQEILQQLHHVKELRTERRFIEFLSTTKVEGLFSPVLNIKCLTLDRLDLDKHHSGIAWLLGNLPRLENLVIDMTLLPHEKGCADLQKWNAFKESFWNSKTTNFECLISNLKTIKIIDFPKQDDRSKHVLKLVQFLVKNARVLQKMVFLLKDHGVAFPKKVFQELLSMPKCSRHAMIGFVKL